MADSIRIRLRCLTRLAARLPESMQLWPGLLALAVLLDLTELIIRKWEGIAALFTRRRGQLAASV